MSEQKVTSDDILSWYEAGLSTQERKRRGHFSTPPSLVELILDACRYRSENDLSQFRVLDPACGSGNFLAGAARRLTAYAERVKLDQRALLIMAQRNIWGFDPDPVACFLAEMQIRTTIESGPARSKRSWHIHQADGLALPWEHHETVDLFLANPPYLAAKNTDLSGYRFAQRRGQADSYLLFLELALQIVRPGGWLALVLPDPVLARDNAARERLHLLTQTTVHHLWHFSSVFSASVGAVVIIAQKKPPQRLHHIAWTREKWQSSNTVQQGTVLQELLCTQQGSELRYLLSEVQDTLIGQLHATIFLRGRDHGAIAPLSRFVEIRRGEEIAKNAPSLVAQRPTDGQIWYPVLRGGVDLRSYCIPQGQYWIARTSIIKPLERYLAPKLLVVKSTGQLQATLDLQGHIVLQTLYLLTLRSQTCIDELYFLLALLNSRLLREYVRVLYTDYKWVQPQIEQHVLAHLPIPTLDGPEQAQIIERAKRLTSACSEHSSVVELKESEELYAEQERAIEALYYRLLT